MDFSSLEKEEFIQSYLQYRWLDETRIKLIDRFFITLLAVLGARFQFHDFFSLNPDWLFALYCLTIIVTPLMARSIITFRRQQRGHMKFVEVIRERLWSSPDENKFSAFKAYAKGKKIYLTKWLDLLSVLLAVLSPALLLDKDLDATKFVNPNIAISIGTAIALAIFCFVAVPYWKYNHNEEIKWDKH